MKEGKKVDTTIKGMAMAVIGLLLCSGISGCGDEKAQPDFKDILKFSETSLKKIWDNKEDEIWKKYLK